MQTGGGEALFEDAELEVSLVADRRDHVRAEALPGPGNDRGLPDRRPGAACAVIGAQPHLVEPQHQRLLAVGAQLDLGVALLQPTRDQLGVLLERPPRRLLRAEPPDAQIPPRRLLRDPDPEAPLDQLAHKRPRPQKPRQPELIGILLPDRLRDLRLLPRRQHRLLTRPPAPLARRQRRLAARPVHRDPLVHRLRDYIQQPRHLTLRVTLTDQRHRPPTQLLLRRLRQPPRVPRLHTRSLTALSDV